MVPELGCVRLGFLLRMPFREGLGMVREDDRFVVKLEFNPFDDVAMPIKARCHILDRRRQSIIDDHPKDSVWYSLWIVIPKSMVWDAWERCITQSVQRCAALNIAERTPGLVVDQFGKVTSADTGREHSLHSLIPLDADAMII